MPDRRRILTAETTSHVTRILLILQVVICLAVGKIGGGTVTSQHQQHDHNITRELLIRTTTTSITKKDHDPKIKLYGANPRFKLNRCEGDCDTNDDCNDDHLVCYQRNNNEYIPGCLGGEKDSSQSDYCIRKIDLPRVRWSSYFPLKECEGDCDNDGDCKGSLICFHRNDNEYTSVPGCRGGENEGSRTDFCILPHYQQQKQQQQQQQQQQHRTMTNFRLKLYWQKGYMWQEESFERKWCMDCLNNKNKGHSNCKEGHRIRIHKCSSKSQRFDFVHKKNGYYQIKVRNTNGLCLERFGKRIYIEKCNNNKNNNSDSQLWFANHQSDGDKFIEGRFEISPKNDSNLCMTQQHHPKHGETVYLEKCNKARSHDTSKWNKY